jgi:hypothetical protein
MPLTRGQETGPEFSVAMVVASYRVAWKDASSGKCATVDDACDHDRGALLAGENDSSPLGREAELLLESWTIDVFHPPPDDWLPERECDRDGQGGEQSAEQGVPLKTGFDELTTTVGHASLGTGPAQHARMNCGAGARRRTRRHCLAALTPRGRLVRFNALPSGAARRP